MQGAIKQSGGAHPNVHGWYSDFLNSVVLPNVSTFSYVVSFGETLVGVALVLGALTGVAAFFGIFMNANYLLAGAVSTNPILAFLAIFMCWPGGTLAGSGSIAGSCRRLGLPGSPAASSGTPTRPRAD